MWFFSIVGYIIVLKGNSKLIKDSAKLNRNGIRKETYFFYNKGVASPFFVWNQSSMSHFYSQKDRENLNNLLYFIAFSLSHWIIHYLISLSPDYQSPIFSLFQSFEKSPPVWLDLLVKQSLLEKSSWLPMGAPAQLLGSRFPEE